MTYSTIAALTIDMDSKGDGAGRKAAEVDNSTDEYETILYYARFTCGTSPTADSVFELYFFREDDHATEYRTDSVGAGDVELGSSNIVKNAHMITAAVVTGVTDNVAEAEGFVENPGPGQWSIGFMNETGVTNNAAGNFIHWVGHKPG